MLAYARDRPSGAEGKEQPQVAPLVTTLSVVIPVGRPPFQKIITHLHFKNPPIEVVSKKHQKTPLFEHNLYRIDFGTHPQNHFKIATFSFHPSMHCFQKTSKIITF